MGQVRWGGMKKVKEFRTNVQIRHEYWKKLEELAEKKDIKQFYKVYCEYLEFDGIYSSSRSILYKMGKLVYES